MKAYQNFSFWHSSLKSFMISGSLEGQLQVSELILDASLCAVQAVRFYTFNGRNNLHYFSENFIKIH